MVAKMGRPGTSDELRAQLWAMWSSGKSFSEISQAVGHPPRSIFTVTDTESTAANWDAFAVPARQASLARPARARHSDTPGPSSLLQRVDLHVFLWCQHRDGAPSAWPLTVVLTTRLGGSPTSIGGPTQVGNFSEQLWGDSPERHQRWLASGGPHA